MSLSRGTRGAPLLAAAPTRSGDVALIVDNGSLVVGTNSFDLGGVGLRFDPNAQGGDDVVRTSSGFRRAFESFFASATGGRMSLETRLQ